MTALIDLDQPAPPAVPRQESWVMRTRDASTAWLVAAALAVVATYGWHAALSAPPAAVVAAPIPATRLVSFAVGGTGQVEYAGIASGVGRGGQIASNSPAQVAVGDVAVLTIRAEKGESAHCRISVDGKLVVQAAAADGHSATCVHRVD